MDLTQIIIIITIIMVAYIVFKFISKIIFKIVLPILIILVGGYFLYQYYGPGNLIEDITEVYCEGDNMDEIKCDCFVKPIILDLETRFTAQQLLDLKNSPLKSTEEFITSYQNKKAEINKCFESKGSSSNIASSVFEDIKVLFINFSKK
jgi:hypothetical protein